VNFDRVAAILVRVAAAVRRVLPWPYAFFSALRAAWGPKGYFRTTGLLTSMARGRPVDITGKPLPLLSYPMIDLLAARLTPTLRVFEYGAGGSTRFFASRVGSVVSVEHDKRWIDELRPHVPSTVTILHRAADVDGAYAAAIGEVEGPFDLVLVDGRDRANCLKHAVTHVSDVGVILVDDTDRDRYSDAIDALLPSTDFRRLDLTGLRPGGVRESTTTLLYRPGNCLGI
jgi:hypothetical protein